MSKRVLDESSLNSALSRRTVLRSGLLGGAGLAAAALIGCGDDDDDSGGTTATETMEATGTGTSEGTATATEEAMSGENVIITPAGNRLPFNFPDPPGDPKAGGTLTVATFWDVGPMDPAVSAAGGTIGPGRPTYNRVIGFVSGPDAPWDGVELRGELAHSWEVSDDGLTATFNLNEGVKWQNVDPVNGRDFTAEDVVYAWNRYGSEGAQSQYFSNVAQITAPDDVTVQVKLNSPQPDFLIPLGSRYLTIHPREIVEDGTIGERAIGTGPMILTEASPGSRVVYERNPDYWDGDVLLDGLEYLILPDAQTRLAQFRVGEVDVALTPVSGMTGLDALLDTNPDTLVNAVPAIQSAFSLSMNLSDPRFADERVRRAMSLAIDRQLTVDVAYEGYGKPLPIIPWFFIFDEEPAQDSGVFGEWWAYNPDEAKKMLAAAGQEDLSFEMIAFNYSGSLVAQNDVWTQNLKDVGVTINVNYADYTEFNSQWAQHSYKEAADGWLANGFDADNYFYNQVRTGAAGNRYTLSDAQIDEWADAQKVELDPDARKEIQRKIWDRLFDNVWRIDKVASHGYDVYGPNVRYLRYVGPMYANYSTSETGAMVDKAWLDT